MFKLDIENSGYDLEKLKSFQDRVNEIHNEFIEKRNLEKEKGENYFLGWMDLPDGYNFDLLEKIISDANKIREESDVLVVLGIGGSFIGAKAVLSALKNRSDDFEVMFLGDSLSERDIFDAIKYLENKDFSINVISKSGNTLETALAFRIFKNVLKKKYENYLDRIYITTDEKNGLLKEFANENGLDTYVIPDNVGGRYSVLSPVGLLPILAGGVDILKVLNGAKKAKEDLSSNLVEENDAIKYAILRYLMYEDKKYAMELVVNYENRLEDFNKWIVQLFAESEGKDEKGLMPVSCIFTRDLHSVGQFIQDGSKNLFETVMFFNEDKKGFEILKEEKDIDELNYLAGKKVNEINKVALEGTIKAHVNGNVPNILLEFDALNEESIGYLIYFLELSCAYSARLIDVNPFNQPGVNGYKENIYKLLGRD